MDIDNEKNFQALLRRLIENYRLSPKVAHELLEKILSALGGSKNPANNTRRTQE